jgi:UrcA family protein
MLKSIATLALLLSSAPSVGQTAPGSVRYSDLDLATPAGIARLDRRIDRVVAGLCGSAFPTDLDGRAAVDRCRTETMKSVSGSRAMLLARAGRPGMIALKGR